MITGWIVYCLIIAALLAIIAAGVDEMLTRRRRSARWIWVGAITVSLLMPAVALVLQQRPPTPIKGAADVRYGDIFDRVRERNVAIEQRQHRSLLARVPQVRVHEWLGADRFVTAAIIICILLATVRVGLDSVMLFRGRRRWRPDLVDGEPVLVSATLGPALVGIIDATIVIPEWVATLPDDERALMLAHEREHRRAGDGLLASAGLLGALCMPWNPALWWMFRRLRTAIEVDCDRRVLRVFPDVERYGRLLVSVAERASNDSSFAITGFSERAGSLARRIRAMTTRIGGGSARGSIPVVGRGVACAAATMAVFVVTPPMPAARLAESLPGAVILAKSVADSVASDPLEEAAATMSHPNRILAAARDLPPSFLIDDPGAMRNRLPLAGRCATWLRDPRNGIRLQLKTTHGSTGAVVQRGDTAWTRITQTGFYRVSLPGAYGVAADRLLRVGCGTATKVTIERQIDPSSALSDLESQTDDRARRIAKAVAAAIAHTPDEVELYHGRLNIAISDHDVDWRKQDPNERWAMTRRTWEAARDVLGRAAMPETLAFSMSFKSGTGLTLVYYSSHPR